MNTSPPPLLRRRRHGTAAAMRANGGPRHLQSLLLRGGRLRKTARGVLTFAPWLGMAAAVALAGTITLSLGGSAQAGSCSEDANSPGTWTCSGAASFQSDEAIPITVEDGETLVINEEAGFGVTLADQAVPNMPALLIAVQAGGNGGMVSLAGNISNTFVNMGAETNADDGLRITNASDNAINASFSGRLLSTDENAVSLSGTGAGAITFTSTGSIVTDSTFEGASATSGNGGHGVNASHSGAGDLNITTATVTADDDGIYASHTSTTGGGTVSITANGAITAGGDGIYANSQNTGAMTITAAAITADTSGIEACNCNTNSTTLDITANGSITASGTMAAGGGMRADAGINALLYGTGDLTITTHADITGNSGIIAASISSNSGAIVVTVGGTVDASASSNAVAISMAAGGSHRLIFNPGGAIADGDAVTSDKTNATLELAAAAGESGSFDLSDLANFTGFGNFEKTGEGVWSLSGVQPMAQDFDSANVTAGTLRLDSATLELAGSASLTVASGATLELIGGNTISGGTLDNDGTLSFPNASLHLDAATLEPGSAGLTIPDTGTLQISGASTIDGGVTNNGAISLFYGEDTGADDTLTVTDFVKGGSLTLNLNLGSTTTSDDTADSLIVSGMVSGSGATTINLSATGMLTNFDGSGVLLVSDTGPGSGAAGDFVAGKLRSGTMSYDFTLARTAASGNWMVTAIDSASGAARCTEDMPNAGDVMCGLPADSNHDTTLTFSADANEPLNLTTSEDFGIHVTSGHAFDLGSDAMSTGMSVVINGPITVSGTTMDWDGIYADHDGSGDVTITVNGPITSAAGEGIYVGNAADSTSLSVAANGDISAQGDGDIGIHAIHRGTGDNSVTSAGVESGSSGLNVFTATVSAAMNITVNGDIRAGLNDLTGADGVNAFHRGDGDLNITIAEGASVSGSAFGIDADSEDTTADNNITITANGPVTATGIIGTGTAIDVNHMGAGDVTITTAPGAAVTGVSRGIQARASGSEASIVLDIAAPVRATSASAPSAVALGAGGSSQTLRLRPGAAFFGSVHAGSNNMIPRTFELTGAADESSDAEGSLDFADIGSLSNFNAFVKNGDNRWSISGDTGLNQFDSATVNAGTLRLDNMSFNMRGSMATPFMVATGATLEISGNSRIHMGALDLSASGSTLSLAADDVVENNVRTVSTDDMLTVANEFTAGGALVMNVNLTDGTADRLTLSGSVSGSGSGITLYASGDVTDPMIPDAGIPLIVGSGEDDVFTAVQLRTETEAGLIAYDFTLEPATDENDNMTGWNFTAVDPDSAVLIRAPGGNGNGGNGGGGDRPSVADIVGEFTPTYEGYAATLTRIGRLSTAQQRFASRVYAATDRSSAAQGGRFPFFSDVGRVGVWSDWQAGRAVLTPTTSTDSANANTGGADGAGNGGASDEQEKTEYEIRQGRLRFGFDAPLHEQFLVGGSLSLGEADARIRSPHGDGDIDLKGFAAALSAVWFVDDSFYADWQAQYAAWDGTLTGGDTLLADNNDAKSWSAAIEAGYRFPLTAGFSFTPQAQLIWTDVDFSTFTDPDGSTLISAGDGETLTTRLGLALGRKWDTPSSSGAAYADTNLRLPIDSETSALVNDVAISSEQEEISIDAGLGVTWSWNENYSVFGELYTAQGDDIEEYRGSIGARLGF